MSSYDNLDVKISSSQEPTTYNRLAVVMGVCSGRVEVEKWLGLLLLSNLKCRMLAFFAI
jgi:hypothetical protein